jgi:hypothetical protein
MTRLIEVLISLAIVAVLFLLVALVLPSSRHLNEKVETNRKITIVYDTLNSLRRFNDWNPLVLRDPRMKLQLSGPASGVGARMDYDSSNPQLGKGSWEITATEPNASVTYAITNPQRGHDKVSTFSLKPTGRAGRNVEITQSYDVDYGWDLVGRYAGLYVSRHVGDDMELGLQRLTNMLAQVPNVDYRVQGSKLAGLKLVDVPAEDLLTVSAGSIERNNEKIKASMKANMEWINRTMAASGLVAAGPMRIISTELGRENYTFDVAQPVRLADSTIGGDAPLSGLKLQGPVQYLQVKAGRSATASYSGYMAELDNVRNALRAWALTQGYEVTDRPYEVYKNGIDQAFTADGEYDVYWTLK